MSRANAMRGTYEDGREDQFRAMMKELAAMQAKYKGVRGELLAKVSEELAKLKPSGAGLSVVAAPAASMMPASLPSCRVCGRDMKLSSTDGQLVCQNGHTRLI